MSASRTRCSAKASRPCSCSRPGRSPTRASGSSRCPTSPGTSAWITFDPRGNGRSDRPDRPADYGPRSRRRGRPRGARRDRHRPSACSSSHCAVAAGALVFATRTPSAWLGAVFIDPPPSRCPRRCPSAPALVRGAARDLRGLGEVEPPLLGARLPRLPRFLLRPLLSSEPHSTKQIEDSVGWGLEGRPGDARPHDRRRPAPTSRRSASCSGASAARCS